MVYISVTGINASPQVQSRQVANALYANQNYFSSLSTRPALNPRSGVGYEAYMTTWKESGEVPDSDEDDILDSQTTVADGLTLSPQHASEDEEPVQEVHDEDQSTQLHQPISHGFAVQAEILQNHSLPQISGSTSLDVDNSLESLPAVAEALKNASTSYEGNTPTIVEADYMQDIQTLAEINSPVVEDEISTSYVRLSSPLSSLSSLDSIDYVIAPDAEVPHIEIERDEHLESNGQTQDSTTSIRANFSSVLPQELSNPYGRSLRQRNAIQLHPYMLEQEKYRQSLKARGMVPIVLQGSATDHGSKSIDTPLPEGDSQDTEYLQEDEDVQMGESQSVDFNMSSSPPLVPDSIDSVVRHMASQDDDELPSLDTFLQGVAEQQRLQMQKKRSHSTHRKIQSPQAQNKNSGNKYTQHDIDPFDIPTSPESGTLSRTPVQRLPPTVSALSRDTSPIFVRSSTIDSRRAGDTPITSIASAAKPFTSVRPSQSPINIDQSSEDDSSAISISSDESIQIRRVGKKIRGVLPASHLRLDQNTNKLKNQSDDKFDSLKTVSSRLGIARGVAIPKSTGSFQSKTKSTHREIYFESDSSESEPGIAPDPRPNVKSSEKGIIQLTANDTASSAEEEDVIDGMLPPRKRSKTLSGSKTRKHQQPSVTLGPKAKRGAWQGESSHNEKARYSRAGSSGKVSRRQKKQQLLVTSQGHSYKQTKTKRPPKLGILDVVDTEAPNYNAMPLFIKIAVRTSKSRNDRGRQSPSKKFIKLAHYRDSQDAHSILQEWKNGQIPQKTIRTLPNFKSFTSRKSNYPPREQQQPEIPFENLSQLTGPRPFQTSDQYETTPSTFQSHIGPRRFLVSKDKHDSPGKYRAPKKTFVPRLKTSLPQKITQAERKKRPISKAQFKPNLRQGQLELVESSYQPKSTSIAFKSTKRSIDTIYKNTFTRSIKKSNIQLDRFLADSISTSIESPDEAHNFPIETSFELPETETSAGHLQKPRIKKRAPKRIDANATAYRQSSEPLKLQHVISQDVQTIEHNSTKLLDLGSFGTQYPITFNVSPLKHGVYFHNNTLIGSGRLSKALGIRQGSRRTSEQLTQLDAGEISFSWGFWDERVSSEFGLYFDWITDQITSQGNWSFSTSPSRLTGCLDSVVDYVQQFPAYSDSTTRDNFLSRVSDVIDEFATRLESSEYDTQEDKKCRVDILVRCVVIILQAIRISGTDTHSQGTSPKLAALLSKLARQSIRLLLSLGFDDVRKLYGDLEYLSFREKGIENDRSSVHAWVILIRILTFAQLQGNSFWDIVNSQLEVGKVLSMDSAIAMEDMWYSIFSLLPLFEFDDYGVILPDIRHGTLTDNWTVPQYLLKRVFVLYDSASTQSPNFNNYCRAILRRCHHLVIEWGWWNVGGLSGTMFDFFASHNLAHLRNEEVYSSPRFLEQLDADPSLAVEPEDRCFHIFLKVVALALQRLRQNGNTKAIRNLVARVLPNHDREYPKEEAIHQKDLASLRNHHDIICTLYWAASQESRPSLILVEELVVAENSHKEACLINIKSWTNLARFILKSTTLVESYQPLLSWQENFFQKLMQQFLEADAEVRKQVDKLAEPTRISISETFIQQTVSTNRTSTMATLRAVMHAIHHVTSISNSPSAAMSAFRPKLLCQILNQDFINKHGDNEGLISDCINILLSYMERIDYLQPRVRKRALNEQGQSSRDLGESQRDDMIMLLRVHILPYLSVVTRDILESRLCTSVEPSFMSSLVKCWSTLASLLTENLEGLRSFVVGVEYNVFGSRKGSNRANIYWTLFLAELSKRKSIDDLEDKEFNIGREWLLAIIKPNCFLKYENRLTYELSLKKYFLVCYDENALGQLPENSESARVNYNLVKGAISVMRSQLDNSSNQTATSSNRNSFEKEKHALFSSILKGVMDTIKQHLMLMTPGSANHQQYLTFVQDIIAHIRSHASEIRPLADFFIYPSNHYWPKESDRNLYAAGLVSYSLRLSLRSQYMKTAAELFYYLYNGWRNALISSHMMEYIVHLSKGMRVTEFAEFMLTEFVPATLEIGFNVSNGWLLSATILPAISRSILKLLRLDALHSWVIFLKVINLFKLILNGTNTVRSQFGDSIQGVHPMHRGILAAAFQFCLSVIPHMSEYVEQCADRPFHLEEAIGLLSQFTTQALTSFDNKSSWHEDIPHTATTEGDHVRRFATMMGDDLKKNWTLDQTTGELLISGSGIHGHFAVSHEFVASITRPLKETLSLGVRLLELESGGPTQIPSVSPSGIFQFIL